MRPKQTWRPRRIAISRDPAPPAYRGENTTPLHNPLAIYVVIPMDLARAKRVQDLISSSTISCLITHVIAFARLQHTAGKLLPGPMPPLSDILELALRAKDTGLSDPIEVCGPLLKPVMDICKRAIDTYVDNRPSREDAIKLVAGVDDAVIDTGGIHSNGKLIVRVQNPVALLDAALIYRETEIWTIVPAPDARLYLCNVINSYKILPS